MSGNPHIIFNSPSSVNPNIAWVPPDGGKKILKSPPYDQRTFLFLPRHPSCQSHPILSIKFFLLLFPLEGKSVQVTPEHCYLCSWRNVKKIKHPEQENRNVFLYNINLRRRFALFLWTIKLAHKEDVTSTSYIQSHTFIGRPSAYTICVCGPYICQPQAVFIFCYPFFFFYGFSDKLPSKGGPNDSTLPFHPFFSFQCIMSFCREDIERRVL